VTGTVTAVQDGELFFKIDSGQWAGRDASTRADLVEARYQEQGQTRQELEREFGQVWDTSELQRDFEVEGFGAPFVVVRRKSDGQRGSLEFQHMPRFYFSFTPA